MNNFLEPIWAAFDADEAVFGADYVRTWPPGALDWLIDVGLVKRAAAATQITCPDCPDRHVEEIESVVMSGDVRRFYVKCPESMRAWVDESALVQYQPDFQMLARQIQDQLNIDGRVTNRVTNRLWRIGESRTGRKRREVFLARAINCADGIEVLEAVPQAGNPIVLFGGTAPLIERMPAIVPTLVPLPGIMHVVEGKLTVDVLQLIELVGEWEKLARNLGGNREPLRQWMLTVLDDYQRNGPTYELIYALDSQGMSTREIEDELGRRGCGIDHSTIARHIKRKKRAKGMSGVGSSSSVLRSRSSQPRDMKGRALIDAQPMKGE